MPATPSKFSSWALLRYFLHQRTLGTCIGLSMVVLFICFSERFSKVFSAKPSNCASKLCPCAPGRQEAQHASTAMNSNNLFILTNSCKADRRFAARFATSDFTGGDSTRLVRGDFETAVQRKYAFTVFSVIWTTLDQSFPWLPLGRKLYRQCTSKGSFTDNRLHAFHRFVK